MFELSQHENYFIRLESHKTILGKAANTCPTRFGAF